MNAHADSHCWFLVLQQVLVELFQPSFDFHCSFNRGLSFRCCVLFQGNTEHSEHSIPCEFVHHAAPLGDSRDTDLHPPVQPVHQFPWTEPFRDGGEGGCIREQHSDRQLATFKAPVAEQFVALFPKLLGNSGRGGLSQELFDLLNAVGQAPWRSQAAPLMLNKPKVGMAIPTQMCSHSQVSPPATPALSATTTSTLCRRVGTFSLAAFRWPCREGSG